MAEDSLLYKVTGFIEIEKPDLTGPPGGQLPGVGSRPNFIPSPRPPLNLGGLPNLPAWVSNGGISWQLGSVTAKPPSYGGGNSGGYLNVNIILGNNPNPTLPQTDQPPPLSPPGPF